MGSIGGLKPGSVRQLVYSEFNEGHNKGIDIYEVEEINDSDSGDDAVKDKVKENEGVLKNLELDLNQEEILVEEKTVKGENAIAHGEEMRNEQYLGEDKTIKCENAIAHGEEMRNEQYLGEDKTIKCENAIAHGEEMRNELLLGEEKTIKGENAIAHGEEMRNELFLLTPYTSTARSQMIDECYSRCDEIDGIRANEVCDKFISQPPKWLPGLYISMRPKNQPLPPSGSFLTRLTGKRPDQKSSIYISHMEDAKLEQDEFGASIVTYCIKQKGDIPYHQHFFDKVIPGSPADKMKIRNFDELVSLNHDFVPPVSHVDLLKLFNRVKVDGHTRFKLIIRRVEEVKSGSKKKWEWLETSAILCPDVKPHTDASPKVEDLKFDSHIGDELEGESVMKEYKIPGSQYFLTIRGDKVYADVQFDTEEDRSKRICKWSRYKFNPEKPDIVQFWAALSNEGKTKYISMGEGNKIGLDDVPTWFQFQAIGSKLWFKKKEQFLSCERKTWQLEASSEQFLFEEFPADSGLDHPDGSTEDISNTDRDTYVTAGLDKESHEDKNEECIERESNIRPGVTLNIPRTCHSQISFEMLNTLGTTAVLTSPS